MHRIRRCHEHYVRQIERQLHKVVAEGIVLFRVQHFKQCCRRVAAEVSRHLVDFVEQEDRINTSGCLHPLDNPARHSTDIGAAMPADFRFITHAAKRDADELAVQGMGDGAGQ
ncbi:hypothetical protein D3C81_1614660 [compost metagenome]